MKRNILCTLVIVCFLCCLSNFALAQDKIILTLGHDTAVGGIQDRATNIIAQVAKEKSNGRLEIHIFPANQLGTAVSQFESVIAGSQDLIWTDLTNLANFVKDYNILTMAYAFRDQDHMNNFMKSPTGQELKEKLLDKGILMLREHANMLPRIVVSKKLVKTPDDVEGIKMRVPGIPIFQKVWEAMGTKTVLVPWGETYLALSQGVMDAMECGFEFVYESKFYEVAKYVALTNHARGLRGMFINPDLYEGLPEDLKDVLMEAAIAGEKYYNEQSELAAIEQRKWLVEKAGVTITEVDQDVWNAKIAGLADQLEEEGFWSKGLYEKVQEVK